MYYVILGPNKEVIVVSETMEIQENGNYLVKNGAYAIAGNLVGSYKEITDVPVEVEPLKYCYNETKGFYLNPDWEPPQNLDYQELARENKLLSEKLISQEQKISDLEVIISDILMGGGV